MSSALLKKENGLLQLDLYEILNISIEATNKEVSTWYRVFICQIWRASLQTVAVATFHGQANVSFSELS